MTDYDAGRAEAGDSLIAILDELIEVVASARGVPMSASAMINRSEVLDLLETSASIYEKNGDYALHLTRALGNPHRERVIVAKERGDRAPEHFDLASSPCAKPRLVNRGEEGRNQERVAPRRRTNTS